MRLKKNFRFGIGLDRGGSRRGNGSTSLWTVVEFLKIERPHWRWNNSLAIIFACSREYWSMAARSNQLSKGVIKYTWCVHLCW